MAREIEMYLMTKFQSTLELKEKNNSRIPMFSLFQEIKVLLEEILGHKTQESQPTDSSIREKLYYLNDVLSECQSFSKRCGFYTPQQLLKINKIKTDLNKVKTDLNKVKMELKTAITNPPNFPSNGNNSVSQPNGVVALSLPRNRDYSQGNTGDPVDHFKIHGFVDEMISLQKLILRQKSENGFNSIAIVGMAGIGKTAISELMFKNEEVRNDFSPRIWVCMSKRCDKVKDPKIEIVKIMLVYLGVEEEIINQVLEDRGLGGLLCTLHQQLVGKRYLIVFDDAWEAEPWYGQLNSELTSGDENWDGQFGYGLPKWCGGTVIVNSRNEEIAQKMVGEEKLLYLRPFSDPEICWEIFKDYVEKDGNGSNMIRFNPPNVEELKKEIKEKCYGLPLAAKIMGQLTRNNLMKLLS